MRILFVIIFLLPSWIGAAQDKPAYKIYDKNGNAASYQQLVEAAEAWEVILFGEMHNSSIVHWLQLQLFKDLYQKDSSLIVGFEMFERDIQPVLDEYVAGWIDEKNFIADARAWKNYKTDYRPLVEYAKDNVVPVLATNIPRRYANLVYRKGLDALDTLGAWTQSLIPPLPMPINYELSTYKDMAGMMSGHGGSSASQRLVEAQAVKDATMAHTMSRHSDRRILHFHGAYHSLKWEGICWYLKQYVPNLRLGTVHTVEQNDIHQLEENHHQTADFVICVPSDMTKTYEP